MNIILEYIIPLFLTIVIIRMTVYSFLAELQRFRNRKFIIEGRRSSYVKDLKNILIIVPAFNEEKCILTTLESINKLIYPQNKLRVLVVDDGSTDNTLATVKNYIKSHKLKFKIKVISKENGGKAEALNTGIRHTSFGELVMCLDSDSKIKNNALVKMHKYFLGDDVAGIACNVGFEGSRNIIGLAQHIEFLIGGYNKRVHNLLNMEFIIGGIGSTYRRSILEKINLYPSNTMVEDMALSVKIINEMGNTKYKIINAFDVITYSQSVTNIKDLIKQRYRWKYGAMQVFYINRKLLFNLNNKKYSRTLTFMNIPSVFIWYFQSFFDPIIIIMSAIYLFQNGGLFGLVGALTLNGAIAAVSVKSSGRYKPEEFVKLIFIFPFVLILLMIISIVESIALYKSIFNLFKLKKSIGQKSASWVSPKRV
jgi:biofilm PGA synthesis N-glycosyltransferase PgaC